ncbi:MAG: hypothetical protein HC900_09840 [Methylacidiphilales bacterium]|nr:hypothetical protein [Candidatus Methylacidiphilales bacterium]
MAPSSCSENGNSIGPVDPSARFARFLAAGNSNTLSASNALFSTYVPVNLATVRSVMEARKQGRAKLRENRTRSKVGTRPPEKSERDGYETPSAWQVLGKWRE